MSRLDYKSVPIKKPVKTRPINEIMLITKIGCPECKLFEPEWDEFLEEIKLYDDFIRPKVTQIVFNPSAKNAEQKRKEILDNYAEEGKDGYPLLLFYINGVRWKPYWFNSQAFRTAKAIMFSCLLAYKYLPLTIDDPDYNETPTGYIKVLNRGIWIYMQSQFDKLHTAKDRRDANYPTIQKIIGQLIEFRKFQPRQNCFKFIDYDYNHNLLNCFLD